ncbi:hypothetical protein PybrP1_003439, partial [[Pythium] brassicae (nom. inval.)]
HPLLALEQLMSQCAELMELRPLCESACGRLTALAAHVEAAERADASLGARLDALIERLEGFVERGTRGNIVSRLTDVHRLHALYELNLALDAAFRASNALHVDAGRDWKAQWQQATDFAEQRLKSAVLDRTLLRRELEGSDERQREALALVKFAAENLVHHGDEADGQTEFRTSRVQLLKKVFRLLLSVVNVEVPVIPDWFISPNDVAPLKTVITSDASADVRPGEWLPLANTVIVKQFSTQQHGTSADAPLPERDARVDDETWALVSAMCSLDPETRPSIATVVASLKAMAESARAQSRSDAARASRVVGRDAASLNAPASPPGYADYRRSFMRSRQGSLSDSKSASSDSSSVLFKSEQPPPRAADTVSVVTLHQKWLGIKINSIGTKIVVSKFLRAASGAMGEIETSGTVQLGDVIYAVNNQTVRGMDRHRIGAFIQSTPRPLALSFKREHGLLDDCFRFNGLRLEEHWRDRGSVVPLPGALDRVFGPPTGAFSLELWFSLADAADSFLGGILLGAQDVSVDDSSWAYVHKQLVVVDPQGNLCCSLLSSEAPLLVARELTPNIWYQLVVTFKADERQLSVYLDGELRHTATDCSLFQQWERLPYVNVGSGCISGISPAKPTPDFAGWYGFNGLVHDLKVWRSLLGDIEVHQLFRGASDCVDIPSYSLRRDFRKKALQSVQLPERVRASRPQHVVAQVY